MTAYQIKVQLQIRQQARGVCVCVCEPSLHVKLVLANPSCSSSLLSSPSSHSFVHSFVHSFIHFCCQAKDSSHSFSLVSSAQPRLSPLSSPFLDRTLVLSPLALSSPSILSPAAVSPTLDNILHNFCTRLNHAFCPLS